jgi:hypothetical protein
MKALYVVVVVALLGFLVNTIALAQTSCPYSDFPSARPMMVDPSWRLEPCKPIQWVYGEKPDSIIDFDVCARIMEAYTEWEKLANSFSYSSSADPYHTNTISFYLDPNGWDEGDSIRASTGFMRVNGHPMFQIKFNMDPQGLYPQAVWTAESTPEPNKQDIRTIALHEFGHAVGLENMPQGCTNTVMVGLTRFDGHPVKSVHSYQEVSDGRLPQEIPS